MKRNHPAALSYYWRLKMPKTARYTTLVAKVTKQAAYDMSKELQMERDIALKEALELLIGLARMEPRFLRRQLVDMVSVMLQIAEVESHEKGIWRSTWHTTETEDEDAGETSNYSVGHECLDRLAFSLGGIMIVPVASEQLPAYLDTPGWQKHHAALISLAQIAEGCAKVMIKNLE
ncbi:hypothetical protein F3Y22_tig00110156pilonHSYRG00577 [Hibiscus syriacus]|uniref:Uncharacterized protein n=1 Tax=Hibiscus syriacus TaxID=106335 RepID=A0A6A3BHN9_HIBSY|nr:hypothetical protein F3Y22_tig00110156pilonHSYRG00577 [Hibiscus syriacus]